MTKFVNESPEIFFGSKQQILKTATKLFSDFGFLGVSMSDIAGELNITKAAIYYHFRSKKELYLEVLGHSYKKLSWGLKIDLDKIKSPRQRLFYFIKKYLDFGLKEKNLIRCLTLRTPYLDSEITNYIISLKKKINRRFRNILRGIIRNKKVMGRVDRGLVSSLLLGIMNETVLEAALFNKKFNIKKKSLQVLQIISPILKLRN